MTSREKFENGDMYLHIFMYKHCKMRVTFEAISFFPPYSQTSESIFILFVFIDVNCIYAIHVCICRYVYIYIHICYIYIYFSS